MYTAEIKTIGESMARSTTEARSFKIFMDEPPELGGQDGAPSPEQLETLRSEVEARCPVSNNIAQPTPVEIALTAA
jgi:uncharacterized OsmC-like protein